jgi:hypothetical protein
MDYENEKKIFEKELNNDEEPQPILSNDISHDLDLRILKKLYEYLKLFKKFNK